jgi:hypothetical protein
VKIEFRHCSLLDGKDNLNCYALSRWAAPLIPRKTDSYAGAGENSNSISHRLEMTGGRLPNEMADACGRVGHVDSEAMPVAKQPARQSPASTA